MFKLFLLTVSVSFFTISAVQAMDPEERGGKGPGIARKKAEIDDPTSSAPHNSTPVLPQIALTKEVVEIVFSDGKHVTYDGAGLSFRGPVSLSGGFSIGKDEVRYGNICIDRQDPLAQAAAKLQGQGGIASAVVTQIPLTPDERVEKLEISFNTVQGGLSPERRLDALRELYERTRQFQDQGSALARRNLPDIRTKLAVDLANSAQTANPTGVPTLREAVSLLEENAELDSCSPQNLPTAIFLLGVALANSSLDEKDSTRAISQLREGMQYLEEAIKMGKLDARSQLAEVQGELAARLHTLLQGFITMSFKNQEKTKD